MKTAIANGELSEVQRLLDIGVHPDWFEDEDPSFFVFSPLLLAVYLARFDVVCGCWLSEGLM